MKTTTAATPSWTTSSYGGAADTSPMELSALQEHLGRCQDGRWFALRCVAERMDAFLASRLFTTLAVVGLVIGTGALLS